MDYKEQNVYPVGEKIYYLIIEPGEFETRLLRLQIFKKDVSKSEFGGYSYYYNQTIELKNKKYYSDHIVLSEPGAYIFQVFEFTNLQEPIIIKIMQVK